MENGSKAIEEIARTTRQTISTVERVGRFFAQVMGESIDTTCGMISDTLKFKRWERQIALIDKAEYISAQRLKGKKTIPVSPKFVLPLLEQASIEDNEEIHELYARLLAAAMDPSFGKVRSAYLNILQQVEPIDIKILDEMFYQYLFKRTENIKKHKDSPYFKDDCPSTYESISAKEICEKLKIKERLFRESFDNLCRLGLADSYFEEDQVEVQEDDDYGNRGIRSMWSRDTVVIRHGDYEIVCITALGCSFVQACKYGGDIGMPINLKEKRKREAADKI